jgi:hypothetical protein
MTKTLLINTITAWYEPHRARHQLALSLAKNFNIIFIARNELGRKYIEIQEITDRITLIVPHFPIDYRYRYRLPVINEYFQNWLFNQLREMYPGIIVVNFDFTAHRIFNFFRNVIYYCNDEYIGNSKYPNWFVNRYHRICENRVITHSVLNISTSEYLTCKMRKLNPNTYEILLGVTPIDLPQGYTGLNNKDQKKIKLGLMGIINKKQISINLINEIIEDSSFELIIIGPVEKSFMKGLILKDRVRFTGILKGQELLNELMKIDVGLALYNVKRINAGATPNKLWQYLSVGKPLVISKIPNIKVEIFPKDSVYLYDGKDPVRQLICKAFSQNTPERAMERIHFSRMNTWDNRAHEFVRLIETYLGN